MIGREDHVVQLDEGFYDMTIHQGRMQVGTQLTVTKQKYQRMKGSDPSVQLVRILPPDPAILKAVVESARKEKREKDAQIAAAKEVVVRDATPEEEAEELELVRLEAEAEADYQDDEKVQEPKADWKPVGWYKAQLSKDGGLEIPELGIADD